MTLISRRHPPLGEHRAQVREYLRDIALPFESVAGTIVREQLASEREAELLRPSLAIWACVACGGSARGGLPVAAAIALFEGSARLHDQSAEDVRTRWGLGQSLNAGDALYAVAFRTLAENIVDPPRRLAAARTLARAVLGAIEGRLGAMESGALAAGAFVAGASRARATRLARAGRLLAGISWAAAAPRARRAGESALLAVERCGIDALHRAALEELVAYLLDQT
jgi:hypothetical protein